MARSCKPQRTRGRHWATLAVGALWLTATGGQARAAEVYSADTVKAAFVLRFASYVTWPDKNPDPVFRIAVLGDRETAARLAALIEDRSINDRPIEVRQITDPREARNARILYISGDRRTDLRALLRQVQDRSLLTITDSENGLAAGSIINFMTVDRRVRFEVSMQAARRAGLQISSEMLAVAVRVVGGQPLAGTAPQAVQR